MRLVIIGNGIAALTAARTLRKLSAEASIQMISDETDYPFARTALMYVYMGQVDLRATECYERNFYPANRIELIRGTALRADLNAKQVFLKDGRVQGYDFLLIASGSRPAFHGWPGQELRGVQGLYSLRDLQSIQTMTAQKIERAVVVGGGLIGIELAEMLHSRAIPVTMLVREERYAPHILGREESEMVQGEIRRHGIDLRLSTGLKEILGTNGRVSSIVTSAEENIPCGFVGLAAGVSPNVDFAAASGIPVERGILVRENLEAAAGVFAAGDCAQLLENGKPGRVEQLWYTARMQGETAGRVIAAQMAGGGNIQYDPGIWFNSAKFFGIEYQTYGRVSPEAESLYLELGPGKSLRIAHEAGKVKSFSLMGIRARHRVCESWIREGRDLEYVAARIDEMNFDPEFSRRYGPAVREAARRLSA